MDIDGILRLIEAAEAASFDVFELRGEDFELKLERQKCPPESGHTVVPIAVPTISGSPATVSTAAAPVMHTAAVPAQSSQATGNSESAPVQQPHIDEDYGDAQEIRSPLIGVYHQLPDGKAVKAGDFVKKGEVLCLVEAMKLMNEILMPEDGEIVWAAPDDGQMVEYDDLLFRYIGKDA